MTSHLNYWEVQDWLAEIFEKDGFPNFENNETTISILSDLMISNKQREVDIRSVISEMKLLIKQYEVKGKKCQQILQGIQITADTSESMEALLQVLVFSISSMDLNSPEETDFLFSVMHLQDETFRIKALQASEDKLIAKLRPQLKDALAMKSNLERVHDLSKKYLSQLQNEVKKKTSKGEFRATKITMYNKELENQALVLKKSGITPELYHSTLVKENEKLFNLKEKLENLQTRLEGYFALPPDVEITKARLEQLRAELTSLEATIAKEIDNMYLM